MSVSLDNMYTWCINTCNADNVGYSQTYRNQKTVNGVTYYDCSSFVNYALLAGGFDTPLYAPQHNAVTTASLPTLLTSLGWEEKDITGEWLSGDVVWKTGHTEVVFSGGISQGITMGAHGSTGYSLADQVSINTGYSTSGYFTRIFRYGSGGATETGSSIYVVAALAGNAYTESRLITTAENASSGAYGLWQWYDTRKTAFVNWCTENSYDKTDYRVQCDYLSAENSAMTGSDFDDTKAFLSADSSDIEYLALQWAKYWEVAPSASYDERVEKAKEAYAYIKTNANSSAITAWVNDESNWLDNAVLLYRYLSNGGGGGGGVFSYARMNIMYYLRPLWKRRC